MASCGAARAALQRSVAFTTRPNAAAHWLPRSRRIATSSPESRRASFTLCQRAGSRWAAGAAAAGQGAAACPAPTLCAVAPRRGAATASGGEGSSNIDAIRSEFTSQAAWFEAEWGQRSKLTNDEIVGWALDAACAAAPETFGGRDRASPTGVAALDVACGTGVLTRALAPLCESVHGIDATEAMLDRARAVNDDDDDVDDSGRSGDEHLTEGPQQPRYVLGDAAAMPSEWAGRFGLVATRLAVHHFPDPAAVVAEMARVCAPGGIGVIIDIVSDGDDPAAAAVHNRLETLRDPTHTRALSHAEVRELLPAAGFAEMLFPPAGGTSADARALLDNEMDLVSWMEATGTPDDAKREIVAAVEAELAGGAPTGMRPRRGGDGRVCFVHRYAVVVARR